jgi:hypothetical protein
MRNRKHKNRGGSMVEFCLLCPVWVTLLLGTLWFGSAMIRSLMVQQAARDLASMYCRAVDFSADGAGTAQDNILPKLIHELGTISNKDGTGVVIFSQLTYVGADQCQLAGAPTYYTTATGKPTSKCANWKQFVFTQRYIVGQQTSGQKGYRTSNFGAPDTADCDKTNQYKIPITKYVSNTNDAASWFTLIPNPDDHPGGYKSGQPIYIVEVFFAGTAQAGYGNGGAYAYAIF